MNRYTEAGWFCRLLTDHGFPTMMAGGCVRDRLFGKEPKDYDLATAALPREAMRLFRKQGYKVVPTGLKHGTISVVSKLQTIEVTTLRTDAACDGRHAEVVFSTDFREDARRRDFTINALFEDSEGRVHDHVGGVDDLHHRALRFVGDPAARIREDYLRILRYFRFLSRYGWEPRPEQLAAIQANLDGLSQLSVERVQSEMDQILASPHVTRILPMLYDIGLTGVLFPFVRADALPGLTAHLLELDSADLRWFSFFYWGAGRMTNQQVKTTMDYMRFTRKRNRMMLGLNRFLNLPQDDIERLFIALQWYEQDLLPPAQLKHYLETCTRHHPGTGFQDHLIQLLDGMARGKPFETPREALMALAPAVRGESLRVAKIYWYLGLCRDSNEVSRVLAQAETYRTKLQSGAPEPLS
ncbi:MAG: CCA tRNA nucleotidyltransferase [Acidobacteriota bacterium]|nr:CCA tRNA nucleotidyltransferase [Acidobacteriota bacterium]